MLRGKTAIVTGSSSGLGEGIARRFAAEGANVVTNARDLSRAERTAQAIEDAGGAATAVEADVTDPAAVDRLVERTVEEYGCLDVMVNNAGIAVVDRFVDQTESNWRAVLDVNITGTFFGVQAAGQQFAAQGGGGQILNVSSLFGGIGVQECAPYNASKAAVNGLTRGAAVEFATMDVCVNALAPGFVDAGQTTTDKSDRPDAVEGDSFTEWPHYGETDDQLFERTPLGRYGTVEEVSACAVFLASGNHYVTGAVLTADGGWSAFGWGSKGV